MELNNIPKIGNWNDVSSRINDNFSKVNNSITRLDNIEQNRKGYFVDDAELKAAYPSPKVGWYAYVGSTNSIWGVNRGNWRDTQEPIPSDVDLSGYAHITDVDDSLAQLAGDTNPKKIVLEQGTFMDNSGDEVRHEQRIRSVYINCDLYSSFTVAEDFEFVSVRFYDEDKNYIGRDTDYYAVNYDNRKVTVPREGASYLRFIIKRKDSGLISPMDDVGLVVERVKEQIEKNRLLKLELYRALLSSGVQNLSLYRLTTQYLPYKMIRKVSVKDGFEFLIAEYDANFTFIQNKHVWSKIANINNDSGAEYCKISIKYIGEGEEKLKIDTNADHGLEIEYGPEIKVFDDILVQLASDTFVPNIVFEQGSFATNSGVEVDTTKRVRSQMLSYELYGGFRLNAGYKFLTVRAWDKSRNYIGSIASESFRSNSREIRLTDRNDIAYIRFVVIRDDGGDLTPSSDFEIEIIGIKKTIDNRIDKQLLPVKFFDASILTIRGMNIRISDGELLSSSIANASDYIECSGYDILQVEMIVGTTEPSYGLAFYDVSKGFIQSFPRLVGAPGSSFVGYNIPSNSAYFRVAYYADTSNQKPFTAQLIKSKDEYAEFNGIVPDKTNSALIRSETGLLDLTSGGTTSATDYADVGGADKIRLPMISGNSLSVTSGLAFYDENKDYITGHLRPYTVQSPYYLYMTYDVPEGAVYVRSTWYSDTFLQEHPDFPDFRIGLIVSSKKELGLSHNTAQRVRALENKVNVLPYYISGDFSKTYKFDYLGPTGSVMAGLTMEYVYGLYDVLQSEFPEMIERNLLGYATGTDGTPNVSFPIYEYHIKKPEEPAYYQNNTPLTPPPVILLLTGVHGLEKISVQSVYEFINAMLHTWKENDLLENLLFNFQYKIIPLANPWGYDNSIRNNARNVNINRNFEYNWEGQGYAHERGEYPLSELETQILANWFENNKDALIEIDFHDTRYTDTSQNGLITYQATVNEYIPKVYSSYIRKMSRRWIDRYSINTNYRVMGRVGYEAIAGTYTQAHHITKIHNASIIEINRTLWGQDYSQVACEISCEQVVNYLSALIDYEIQRG